MSLTKKQEKAKRKLLTKEQEEVKRKLIEKTEKDWNKHKARLIGVSIFCFLFIAWLTYSYWSGQYGNVSHMTSLIIGGILYTFVGAAMTAKGASYKIDTAVLMSMTKTEVNEKLFLELRKTSILTQWGLNFITFGFFIQAASLLLHETIGL